MDFCSWGLKALLSWGCYLKLTKIVIPVLKDLGVFIPAPMSQGMRSDFFLEGPFMPPRMKLDRDPLGGLADMFGQMPGTLTLQSDGVAVAVLCWMRAKTVIYLLADPGSGIGTGPGVIQDRFSPTMGRHRSNQLFNGHGGHLMPSAQSQFGDLGKSFLKSQVSKLFAWWLQLV